MIDHSYKKTLSDKDFRTSVGINRETFQEMLKILSGAEKKKKARGGRPNKLPIESILLMAMHRFRHYTSLASLASENSISKATCCRNIKWVENELVDHPLFSLPGKKVLEKNNPYYAVILIDSTETPIERPKKKIKNKKLVKNRNNQQKKFYSGKKKRHTIKTQVVVNEKTKEVICIKSTHGKCHDFTLLKNSKIKIDPSIKIITDSGYQGIKKLYENAELPKKKSKKHPLTKEEKNKNREISRRRVVNEHVIGKLKRFKIIADRYRNKRTRFELRFNLIAGIYNLELKQSKTVPDIWPSVYLQESGLYGLLERENPMDYSIPMSA